HPSPTRRSSDLDRIDQPAQPPPRRARRGLGRKRSFGDCGGNVRGPIQHPLHSSSGEIPKTAPKPVPLVRHPSMILSERCPTRIKSRGRLFSGSCSNFAGAPENPREHSSAIDKQYEAPCLGFL